MRLIKKAVVFIKSVFLTFYHLLCALFSRENLSEGNEEIIVSLTSYGQRIRYVFLTIESILQQSYKPRCIYLWLYDSDVPSGISGWFLKRQQKRGLTISWLKTDMRSYKKLSPLLEKKEIKFSYVVTADDDVLYPRYWLNKFQQHYSANPDYVYCYRARVISCNGTNGELCKYNTWPLADNKNSVANAVLPTGVSGVCYPRGAIDDEVFNYEAIERFCPYADDIWYKMITSSNHFKSKLVVANSIHFTPVLTGFAKGLEKINLLDDYNSRQFIESMKHFNLDLSDFTSNNCGEIKIK